MLKDAFLNHKLEPASADAVYVLCNYFQVRHVHILGV